MGELQEGAQDTLRLECHCRGELALTHKECAVKWFSNRGNMICEICNHEVLNLRVMHSPTFRVWQHEPVLLIVSMLAYLVFLVIFLMKDLDNVDAAIAISLPFGCLLGLLGSMASTIMVRRRYAWIYSAVEFILVVGFAYTFHHSKGVKPTSGDPEAEVGRRNFRSGKISLYSHHHSTTVVSPESHYIIFDISPLDRHCVPPWIWIQRSIGGEEIEVMVGKWQLEGRCRQVVDKMLVTELELKLDVTNTHPKFELAVANTSLMQSL
uniref:Zinc finger, RING-CH-type, zinc finger, RING/FYVE/PHD-type n=1 Tax=Tanacetum cinerariifolium TaxID=118510 RepID=A0A6L2JGI1_TANCI|nr:zinc finger, RING-CH-type, zinc finger, RING/FYVE/PHD-type [Tanacetum cinerariifolium]